MTFTEQALAHERPASVRENVSLPRKQQYLASPGSWRDQVIYFLLVDRFSDGREAESQFLDRTRLADARGEGWRWDAWAHSGSDRWQGGTLRGVASKLGYLEGLGVTAIWLSPVFRQRGHLDTYHGYGIQDFLEVDPHFGTREDLVELVAEAHQRGIRVILDIIFNHSGTNWLYPPGTPGGAVQPHYTPGRHPFGSWAGPQGEATDGVRSPDDGVWPRELQRPDAYTRAGAGDLGGGDIGEANAEHKRTDFLSLRDLNLDEPGVLDDLARCYKYWIALTGCDGFRIDTLKHVPLEVGRNFCGSVKEFASNLGIYNFLMLAEIAGGDYGQDRYLDALKQNLNAALDIGEMRLTLRGVATGLMAPEAYFSGFDPGSAEMGSHRALGDRHVSILDDHDHVFGEKVRLSADAASDHQVAAGVALQLFTLGIPCIYYGTEQALGGPEASERHWLPGWKTHDRYLREAMFGPEHPRRPGRDGLTPPPEGLDPDLPGFGPFGTAGRHCFDDAHPAYTRIAAMSAVRAKLPVLRHGRQYLRQLRIFEGPFAFPGPGELVAWSRILDDEEALVVLNAHGTQPRGGDVVVDAALNPEPSSMTVVLNTAGGPGALAERAEVPVRRAPGGTAYVEIRDLAPSETVILVNHPGPDAGAVT